MIADRFGAYAACHLALGICLSLPAALYAQAWTPTKGHGAVSLSYQSVSTKLHLWPVDMGQTPLGPYYHFDGKKLDIGPISDQNWGVDFDYGLFERMAVSGSLAYVSSKYGGLRPHREPDGSATVSDDGQYHGSFQDAEFRVRYMVIQNPFVATPFVGYRFPTRDYSVYGHAHTGQHLWETHIGVSVARSLRPLLPEAYIQATLSHDFISKMDSFDLRRNSGILELGYFLTSRLAVRALGHVSRTSNGAEWTEPAGLAPIHNHDQVANERYTHLGGGVSYAVGPRYQVYAVYYYTAWGENTDSANSLIAGMSVNFKGPFAP